MTPSRWVAKAAVLAASVVIAAAIGELSLRFIFHSAPQLDLDIYRKQDGLLLLQPNLRRRHVTRYWDVEVRTNSDGWRDQEPAPAAMTVLGVGDSFAFGWGVELEESFFYLIEQALVAESDVRVVKAGVPGSSTIDQERLLEKLIPLYNPDVVAVALFVGNDFTETGLGGADRLRVVDGLLELQPIDGEGESLTPSLGQTLARKSHLLQLLRAVQFRLQGTAGNLDGPARTWDAWTREFAQIHLREPTPRAEAAIRETFASLDRIAERCRRDGIRLVVLALPRSFQVDRAEEEEMRLALGVEPKDVDLDTPQRLLREWSSRTGIPVVDPLDAFRTLNAGGARLYYTPDAHMTATGHEAVAALTLDEFRRLGVVD